MGRILYIKTLGDMIEAQFNALDPSSNYFRQLKGDCIFCKNPFNNGLKTCNGKLRQLDGLLCIQ